MVTVNTSPWRVSFQKNSTVGYGKKDWVSLFSFPQDFGGIGIAIKKNVLPGPSVQKTKTKRLKSESRGSSLVQSG